MIFISELICQVKNHRCDFKDNPSEHFDEIDNVYYAILIYLLIDNKNGLELFEKCYLQNSFLMETSLKGIMGKNPIKYVPEIYSLKQKYE